ncbi:protein FAM228B isoform X2 [Natator depressus]|uniref:protein FAM228B isoform X2 n=1 Tax=Natator depressus TaxID=27790 RepID=UPI003EC0C284
MQEPSTTLQPCSGAPNMRGSDNRWLLKLKCPRSQTEYDLQTPEQRATSSLARSRSPRTFVRSASERKKACEDWLTQKCFSQVQAVSNEGQDIIAATQSILDRENYFVKEVDKYLKHRDFLELRKKEIQYKKWLECVSEPLLQKIEDKVDSQSSEEIEERKRKQFSLYLNYCNKKSFPSPGPPAAPPHCPSVINPMPLSISIHLPPFSHFFLQAPPPSRTPRMLPPFPFTLLSLSSSPPPLVPASCPFHPSVLPPFYQSLAPFPPFIQPPPLFLRSLPSLTFQVPSSQSFPLPRSLPALSPQLCSSLPPLTLPTFPPLPVPPLVLQSPPLLPPIPSRQPAFL